MASHGESTALGLGQSTGSSSTSVADKVWYILLNVDASNCASIKPSTHCTVCNLANQIIPQDLLAILPMVDALTVLQVTGEQLVQALENGVSQYPKHEGRFPQVSGLSFSFDPSQPSGRRVVPASVRVS